MSKMKSASEYYNDTQTYTGNAGSSTNPYCIETIDDFCSISTGSTISSQYYSSDNFMLVNDINFNDSEYRRGITAVVADCSGGTLYGNGHSIYNMIFTVESPQRCIRFDTIKDVNFVNLIYKSAVISSSSHPLQVKNTISCNFGIFVSSSEMSTIVGYSSARYTDCTFNFFGSFDNNVKFTDGNSGNNVTFNSCWLNFNVTVFGNPCSIPWLGTSEISYGKVNFIDTALTGTITNTATGTTTDNNSSCYCISTMSFVNSYVAIEWKFPNWTASGNRIYNTNITTDGVSFMVTDKLTQKESGAMWLDTNNLILRSLTTAQATDREYLQSISFVTI